METLIVAPHLFEHRGESFYSFNLDYKRINFQTNSIGETL